MEKSLVFSVYAFRMQTFKDLIAIIILLVLSFYVVYFMPQSVSIVFFILPLFLFFISKKDYFWFAYFFILTQGPGYLFADFSGLSQYRLPLYTFLPSFSFTPLDFFVILAILKAIFKGKKTQLKLKKPLLLIFAYMVFSFVIISFIFGTTVDILVNNLRWIFYYTIIISFSYLVNKKDDIYHFILLIFPFVFFILFTQIYFVHTGTEFIDLFNPGFRGIALNSLTKEVRPLMGGVLIPFFSFIFAFTLLEDKNYKLSKLYLYLITILSFFSIFISATRVWFIMFLAILIGYILISRKKAKFAIAVVFIALTFVSILVNSGLISKSFLLGSAWGRLSQVFNIPKAGISSVDTGYSRYIIEFPVLFEPIKENPFIGYGFSHIAMQHYDNDFGFLNTILMFGIVGFSLFVYFFIRYFSMIRSSLKRLNNSNPFRTSLKLLAVAWGGMLIGYFSTWDFFSSYFYKVFFVSVLIAICEFFVRQADEEELLTKQKKLAGEKT